MKSITVTICEKEYPLCMTVEAFDQITQACGGLDKLGEYLTGGGNPGKSVSNVAATLAVLLKEGEANRQMMASFGGGGEAEPRRVPTEVELRKLLLPRQLMQLQPAVISAINESLKQEVEADHAKNGSGAEPQSGSALPG